MSTIGMHKLTNLLIFLFFLSGCYQSSLTPMMMVGPAAGVAQGRIISSAVSTGINYGVKHKTGKFPYEHIFQREKDRIVNKVALIEKKVIETSTLVKKKTLLSSEKLINKKDNIKVKSTKMRWVLGVKKIKTVTQEEIFAANKLRYSYWPEEK